MLRWLGVRAGSGVAGCLLDSGKGWGHGHHFRAPGASSRVALVSSWKELERSLFCKGSSAVPSSAALLPCKEGAKWVRLLRTAYFERLGSALLPTARSVLVTGGCGLQSSSCFPQRCCTPGPCMLWPCQRLLEVLVGGSASGK